MGRDSKPRIHFAMVGPLFEATVPRLPSLANNDVYWLPTKGHFEEYLLTTLIPSVAASVQRAGEQTNLQDCAGHSSAEANLLYSKQETSVQLAGPDKPGFLGATALVRRGVLKGVKGAKHAWSSLRGCCRRPCRNRAGLFDAASRISHRRGGSPGGYRGWNRPGLRQRSIGRVGLVLLLRTTTAGHNLNKVLPPSRSPAQSTEDS
jgi:hypothetical protein